MSVSVRKTTEEERQKYKDYGCWAVVTSGLVYNTYNTKTEALRVARLIESAQNAIKEVEEYTLEVLDGLSEEEKDFLKQYVNGQIVIEV